MPRVDREGCLVDAREIERKKGSLWVFENL
jgi:hypothetical protein